MTFISYRQNVNGGWTDWVDASVCCRSIKFIERSCTNPPPSGNGTSCAGPSRFTSTCEPDECIHGGWTNWTDEGDCCGGLKNVTRTCTNPAPALGGDECAGPSRFTQTCAPDTCDTDGGWTEWEEGICCDGVRTNTRTCTNPAPIGDGAACPGPVEQTFSCAPDQCDRDGGWTEWEDVTICCNGVKNVTRTCTNPAPSGNGTSCAGPSRLTQTCAPDECVPDINGGWTEWKDETVCCEGTKQVSRNCTNPPPSGNGAPCAGPSNFVQTCSPDVCTADLDGGWSEWQDETPCCNGAKTVVRTCTNPAPKEGGLPCEGSDRMTEMCDVDECPGFSEWSDFGPCCYGQTRRTRECVDPPCEGPFSETQPCPRQNACYGPSADTAQCEALPRETVGTTSRFEFEADCCEASYQDRDFYECMGMDAVDGGWSRWSAYTSCCEGTQTRTRSCTNPAPANGGMDCEGPSSETEFCSPNVCSDETVPIVDGGWGEWEAIGPCCFGEQSFYRVCDSPPPSGGGLRCEGGFREERSCTQTETCETENGSRDISSGAEWNVFSWCSKAFLALVMLIV